MWLIILLLHHKTEAYGVDFVLALIAANWLPASVPVLVITYFEYVLAVSACPDETDT